MSKLKNSDRFVIKALIVLHWRGVDILPTPPPSSIHRLPVMDQDNKHLPTLHFLRTENIMDGWIYVYFCIYPSIYVYRYIVLYTYIYINVYICRYR